MLATTEEDMVIIMDTTVLLGYLVEYIMGMAGIMVMVDSAADMATADLAVGIAMVDSVVGTVDSVVGTVDSVVGTAVDTEDKH
ncbi:hypothetical protein GGF43_001881 [Coemansia sp. RSA 2618]|nr:hypothetical protein GGF43_001881 [Coemansia sp. RSA 2618]